MVSVLAILAFLILLDWRRVIAGEIPFQLVGMTISGAGSMMLIILVHELGHALVGTRAGLPLRWLAVGPLMIETRDEGRIRRSPFGGAASGCVVFDLGALSDSQLRAAMRRMSAGGPVASLLLAVICLGLGQGVRSWSSALTTVLLLTGGVSLVV